MNWKQSVRRQAFTLVELLAVIATIAILASLLLPVLGRAKIRAQLTRCRSNMHQLSIAWLSYKDGNADFLVESYPTNEAVWVQGNMRDPMQATNTDLIKAGKLYDDSQSVVVYRCPGDQGVTINGTAVPSVRSYSMNAFMGARSSDLGAIPPAASTPNGQYVLYFVRGADLLPHPDQLWVFVDEDERSINDGFFISDPTANIWYNFPAASAHRHDFNYTLAFADGHCESWRVLDPATSSLTHAGAEGSTDADLKRLSAVTTVRK